MATNVRDRKLVQLLAFLASKGSDNQINKLKAIKLVWAADRYHLRKYGRTVSGDDYYALKLGPVASQLKNIADKDKEYLPEAYLEYAEKFIRTSTNKRSITSVNTDTDLLSDSDKEALDFALENFGEYTGFEIAELSHNYPEWKKFKELIDSGQVARGKISLLDFFKEPSESSVGDPFKIDEKILKSSEVIFKQNQEVERALTV